MKGSQSIFIIVLFSSLILHPSSLSTAAPTQDEVLRSINRSVGGSVDPASLMAAGCVVGAVAILLCLVNLRRQRSVNPKVVNHSGKLLKEVAREINLKPAEIKQLKSLAEGAEVSSPLVLLLCPSVLARAIKDSPGRVDRTTLASVVRKIGAEK